MTAPDPRIEAIATAVHQITCGIPALCALSFGSHDLEIARAALAAMPEPLTLVSCPDTETYAHGYNQGYADGQAHQLWDETYDTDVLADAIGRGRCTLPPDGWWCSRPEGHDGPCPAREYPPVPKREPETLGWAVLYESPTGARSMAHYVFPSTEEAQDRIDYLNWIRGDGPGLYKLVRVVAES